ncbi:uncharacterized protein (DUF697 family) [Rhodobium orientis]|uniref:DUF697 domain-containing protein n=1 Tax=Rhodobium orientis TaxID=34017 RepID=A0A327JU28_9HYPH|nr:YcjF family protein [Rhodobium orientis]MBB4302692.1 uncharacterized protein (DUF697 family) [Rhodobium orientis]MBK5948474.1 hypothetical protein [Rhodobium orientis]RAI29747.1 hypothetical protein CH339_01640 [Rhodobium orientis]
MTKRLPKTSTRTLDDLRDAASAALAEENRPKTRAPENPAADATAPTERTARDEKPDRLPEPVAPPKPAPTSLPAVAASVPAPSGLPTKAAFREACARLIIERHANFGAVAGLVPVPVVDLAAIAAIVERMLRKLSRLYGRPLDTDRSRRLATAMLTGMAAPGIASFTTNGLLKMTPGPHILGVALTSVSAVVLVRIVGEVYLEELQGEAA